MTDNAPRPEPMSRESVLAVLDETLQFCFADTTKPIALREARAAIAALYERCEALERAVERSNKVLRIMHNAIPFLDVVISYTGTEPSDAEGGG